MTRRQGFRLLPEGMRKCSHCHEIKSMDLFYTDNSRASGTSPRCKVCINAHKKAQREDPTFDHMSTRRKWSEDNREKLREQDRLWREANPDAKRLVAARRRARERLLPDTFTQEEADRVSISFEGKCALCDSPGEHLDHFIPIASGHGGTIYENMIPLCALHNTSKHARNPFEWAKTYLTVTELAKFNEAVTYLAALNGMSVEDYEDYVHRCFE